MGITIEVVAGTRGPIETADEGFLKSQLDLRPHALRTLDIPNFVDTVASRAGRQKISMLRIFAHGAPGQQDVGGGITAQEERSDYKQTLRVNVKGVLNHADVLARLRPLFDKGATVELHGCNVADGDAGRKLLYELARLWQVRVLAGTGLQLADRRAKFESPYIEMFPNGRANRRHGLSDVEPLPEDPKTPFIDPTILGRHTIGRPPLREDMLSRVAEKFYEGDRLLWPLIWQRNRNAAFEGATFSNPNRVIPGMTLIVPVKPAMTQLELDTVHAQGRAWRAYN